MKLSRWGIVTVACLGVFLSGCKASYPKKNLDASVHALFQKELGVPIVTRLVGQTLYVAFTIDGLMQEDYNLSEDVVKKLEGAMISISRIALSTDANIDYTVVQARDQSLGVEIRIVRKLQDLKDLFYWRVSKTDFDDRMILEIDRPQVNGFDGPAAATVSAGSIPLEVASSTASEKLSTWLANLPNSWYELSLEEFMTLQAGSRINMSLRRNPFLAVVLGVDQVRARWDAEKREAIFRVDLFLDETSTATVAGASALLVRSCVDAVASVDKKYWQSNEKDAVKAKDEKRVAAYAIPWAKALVVESWSGKPIWQLPYEHWQEKNPEDFIQFLKVNRRSEK